MLKKRLSLLLCLVLLSCLVVTASAEKALVIDQAGLLDEYETGTLTEMAEEIHQKYGMDAVVLTVNSLDGKDPMTYADDYYDQNGYAGDGVLMMVSMAEREYHITTTGEAAYALTDYALYEMENAFLGDLSAGNYYDAFYSYLQNTDYYVNAYKENGAVDGYIPQEDRYSVHTGVVYSRKTSPGAIWLISAGIGLIVAAIAVLVMGLSMNTKKRQHSAGEYMKPGSYALTRHQDLFLYSQVSKQRKPENNNTGGGSGVHRSSSGRSHGGRGGKF